MGARRRSGARTVSLDARLLGRTYDKFLVPDGLAFEAPGIRVEHPCRLGGEIGVTREYPRAVQPRPDGVVPDRPPHRRRRDEGNDRRVGRAPRAGSALLQRDSRTPVVAGSWQASAFRQS